MSCISAIQPRLTKAQLREAKKQKFKFSSPELRPSLIKRSWVLAGSHDPKIRASAASLYYANLPLQRALMMDPDPIVRRALARNPHADASVIRFLAADSDEYVRGFVSLHSKVPSAILFLLMKDESPVVRRLAMTPRAR